MLSFLSGSTAPSEKEATPDEDPNLSCSITLPKPSSSQRRVSIAKGSNITVVLSGGISKSKSGPLHHLQRHLFPLCYWSKCFLELYDGNLILQRYEDEHPNHPVQIFSLLSIRRIDYVPKRSRFSLLLVTSDPTDVNGKEVTKLFTLGTRAWKDTLEWVLAIKHELRNQILVCKSLLAVLQNEGHTDRAEPLFLQMIVLVDIIFERSDHFEVSKTWRLYANWLSVQPARQMDAQFAMHKAETMKQRCEEKLSPVGLVPRPVHQQAPPPPPPMHNFPSVNMNV